MKQPKHKFFAVAALSLASLASIGAVEAAVVYQIAKQISTVNSSNTVAAASWNSSIGYNPYIGGGVGNANAYRNVVLAFTLPTLNLGESISSFTLNLNSYWPNRPTFTTVQLTDIYGLGTSSSFTPGASYYQGTGDATVGVTKLQSGFLSNSTPRNVTRPGGLITSTNLATYINSLYTGGVPSNTYVMLRLSHQFAPTAPSGSTADFNEIGSNSLGGGAGTGVVVSPPTDWAMPYVGYTVVPEPSSLALLAGGAGMLVLRRRRA